MNYPFPQHPYYYPYPFFPPPPPPQLLLEPPQTVYKVEEVEEVEQIEKEITAKKKRGRPRSNGKGSYERSKELAVKGHWDANQNKRYHLFLEMHSNHFINKSLRRADKIFKTMANFIGTRIAEQCRSHHQKMQKKYKNIFSLLKALRIQFFSSANHLLVQAVLEANEMWQYDPLLSEEILKWEDKQMQKQEKKVNENQIGVKIQIKKQFED